MFLEFLQVWTARSKVFLRFLRFGIHKLGFSVFFWDLEGKKLCVSYFPPVFEGLVGFIFGGFGGPEVRFPSSF